MGFDLFPAFEQSIGVQGQKDGTEVDELGARGSGQIRWSARGGQHLIHHQPGLRAQPFKLLLIGAMQRKLPIVFAFPLGGVAHMIRVNVRQQDGVDARPFDARQAQTRIQGVARHCAPQARVDQDPAVVRGHQMHIDVVQLKRQREANPPQTGEKFQALHALDQDCTPASYTERLDVLLQSSLAHYPPPRRGKVRDVYSAGPGRLLIVATDRISAFDCVLASGIPGKGRLLTQMSLFWFRHLRGLTPNHLISADVADVPDLTAGERELLRDRIMYVHAARMVDVECVARGYLVGSGWKDYQRTGAICGIALPTGLLDGSRLPEPIFTPATKAVSGHDENITFEQMADSIGTDLAHRLRELTLAIYRSAAAHAESRGIILADTKFEFGFVGEQLVLADEALTPDSSRFWPREQWKPGGPQVSLDKQYVRLYLETLDWNKQYPAPALPDEVAARTAEKYAEAYARLTGEA